jgi:hypothetical protein
MDLDDARKGFLGDDDIFPVFQREGVSNPPIGQDMFFFRPYRHGVRARHCQKLREIAHLGQSEHGAAGIALVEES